MSGSEKTEDLCGWEAFKALCEGKVVRNMIQGRHALPWALINGVTYIDGQAVRSYSSGLRDLSNPNYKWAIVQDRGEGWGKPGVYEMQGGEEVKVYDWNPHDTTIKFPVRGAVTLFEYKWDREGKACRSRLNNPASSDLIKWLRPPDWM